VLVDVGWSPRDGGTDPTLPSTEVTIEGIFRVQETDDGRRGDGATRIVAAQVPAPPPDAGEPLPGYLMLREPCTDDGCLGTEIRPAPLPQLSLGPHLSYAYQWWLLALLAPFGAVYLLRRDARLEREALGEAQGDHATAASSRERRGARKQPTDEEIEDAL
jgi:cytochrome oxidase assembly protein ShyY1